MQSLSKVPAAQTRGGAIYKRRWLHGSLPRQASLRMPAFSPMMKEGTIARWKKTEGEAFAPGDVLLQIELDFYAADVEAESHGILGKILWPDGSTNVPVEQVIALVAQDPSELAQIQSGQSLSTSPMGASGGRFLSPLSSRLDRPSPRTPTMKLRSPRTQESTKAPAAKSRPPNLDSISGGADGLTSPSPPPSFHYPASMATPSPFRMQLHENVATTPLSAVLPRSATWRKTLVSCDEHAGAQADGLAIRRMIVSNLALRKSKPGNDLNDFL